MNNNNNQAAITMPTTNTLNVIEFAKINHIKWQPITFHPGSKIPKQVRHESGTEWMPKMTDFYGETMLSDDDLKWRQDNYPANYKYVMMDTSYIQQLDIDTDELDEHTLEEYKSIGPYYNSMTKKLPHIFVNIENNKRYGKRDLHRDNDKIDILNGQWSIASVDAIVYNANMDIPLLIDEIMRSYPGKGPNDNNNMYNQDTELVEGEPSNELIDEVRTLLGMLRKERIEDYKSWLEVGICLKCINQNLVGMWIEWSKTSNKYKDGECESKWNSFNKKQMCIWSLRYWAEADDGQAYNTYMMSKQNSGLDEVFEKHSNSLKYDPDFLASIYEILNNKKTSGFSFEKTIGIKGVDKDAKTIPMNYQEIVRYIKTNDDLRATIKRIFDEYINKFVLVYKKYYILCEYDKFDQIKHYQLLKKNELVDQLGITDLISGHSFLKYGVDLSLLRVVYKISITKDDHDMSILNIATRPIICHHDASTHWSKHDLTKVHKLLYTLCGESDEMFKYVECWLADLVQNLFSKKRTAILFKSQEGYGKNMFFQDFLIDQILGCNLGYVAQTKRAITGNFNAALQGKRLIIGDEICFGGDHETNNILKGLVTNTCINIEPKGIDSYTVPDFAGYIFFSNEEFPLKVSQSNRRYVCCEPITKLPYTFFEEFVNEYIKDNDRCRAYYDYLMDIDLSGWKMDVFPQTSLQKTLQSVSCRKTEVWDWAQENLPDVFANGYIATRTFETIYNWYAGEYNLRKESERALGTWLTTKLDKRSVDKRNVRILDAIYYLAGDGFQFSWIEKTKNTRVYILEQ